MNSFYPPGYDGSLDGGAPNKYESLKDDDNDRFDDDMADSIFENPPTWAYSVQRQRRAQAKFRKKVFTLVLLSSLLTLTFHLWQK